MKAYPIIPAEVLPVEITIPEFEHSSTLASEPDPTIPPELPSDITIVFIL